MAATLLVYASPAAHAEVRAGVAKETFALPANVPLAGYSRRHGKSSTGTHDPVGVRALVLQQGETLAVLASADLLIIDELLFHEVRRRLQARGFPPHATLLLAATHTHSGPGAYGRKFFEKISMGHFDPGVWDHIAETMTSTILEAAGALVPVRVAAASANADGLVANRMEDAGPTDSAVTVAGFYPMGASNPLAVVVNFAAHPTTLGAWNTELSADYPGVVVRAVEQRWPEAVVLFLAGSVGDQAPSASGERFERAEQMGGRVAQLALEALDAADAKDAAPLQALQSTLKLPAAQVRLGRITLPRWLGARLVDDDAMVTLIRVGPVAFLGVPCDLAVGLGAPLKDAARSRGVEPVIAGFANDYIGYCIPERVYLDASYESSMAFNGPRAGEIVAAELQRMLQVLHASDQ